MKEIMKPSQIIGKTISKIINPWDDYCIHFTDNSCIVFTAEHGYENDTSVSAPSIDELEISDLKELEIITEKEYKEIKATETKKMEDRRHQEYLRLREHYEGGDLNS